MTNSLRKRDKVRADGIDWFIRNANWENPKAFIKSDPTYYAQECAHYFNDLGLRQEPSELAGFIRAVLDNWERGNVAAAYLTPTGAYGFREEMNRIAAILDNLRAVECESKGETSG